jgi:hypothetical protein
VNVEIKEKLEALNSMPSKLNRQGPKRKKLSKVESEPETPSETPQHNVYEFPPIEPEVLGNVVFRPNPGPQVEFLSAPEREVLYGGAAGGGKSYAILADAAVSLGHPQFRGLLVRRTLDELRELIDKSKELYPKIYPTIKWSESQKTWRMPNGGTLWMSYLEQEKDVMRYQGQSFCYIAFDELTQWPTPYCWDYLRSRLRTVAPDLKLYMRATSNPGGVGHNWVKKMFVDPAPWGKAFYATNIETGEVLRYPERHLKSGQPLFKRRFIPARLIDNPYIYDSGEYEANLLSLPEAQRRMLLEGDWDAIEGAAFPEWNRAVHVVKPFHIPQAWRRFRACDYGYGSHTGVVWFAVDEDERLIVYRELYVRKVIAIDLAHMILDIEEGERISYGVLDSSLWHQRGDPGPSLAEQMIREGCRWRPSDRSKGSRVSGKNEFHRRLQIDDLGKPGIMFFDTCINCIAQIPVLPIDRDNPEDIDTDSEDHLYDAIRYGIMTRPRSSLFDFNPETGVSYRPADPVMGY